MLKRLEQLVKHRARYDLFGREERANALLGMLKRGGHIALIGSQASGKTALFLQAVLISIEIEEFGGEHPKLAFFQFTGDLQDIIQNDDLINTHAENPALPVVLLRDIPQSSQQMLCELSDWAIENEISLVVEFTPSEWKKFASIMPSCSSSFMPFYVVEPSPTEMRQILLEQLKRTDESAVADFTPDTALYTSTIAARVYPHLPEPARSTTFLNNLISYRREKVLIGEPEPFNKQFITKCASIYTGLPKYFFNDSILPSADNLADELLSEVVGQQDAAKQIAGTLIASLAGIKQKRGTLASFIFAGPPASGKTSMAEAVAKQFFGSTRKFFLFDLASMNQESMAEELFGSTTGNGLIGDALIMEPAAVLCFDSIDVAPALVRSKLVRAIQQGRINIGDKELSLEMSVVVMSIQQEIAPLHDVAETQTIRTAKSVGKELIDVSDAIVLFKNMGRTELRLLVKKLISEISEREGLTLRQLDLEVDDEVVSHIVEKGLSTKDGARSIPKQIEENVVVPISMRISEGILDSGQTLHVHLFKGEPAIEVIIDDNKKKRSKTVELKVNQLRNEIMAKKELEAAQEKMRRLNHKLTELDAICDSSMQIVKPIEFAHEQVEQPYDVHRLNLNRLKDAKNEYEVLFENMESALQKGDLESVRTAFRDFLLFERKINRLEVEIGYFDRWDFQDALIIIKQAATDSNEWINSLWQMYSSWALRTGRSVELIYEPNIRGCKEEQITIRIRGGFSFGYLKWEEGIHRLSDTNKNTSVAKVLVYPYLVGNWFQRLSAPIFVEFLQTQALKSKGQRINKIRSFVKASLPHTGDEILLQNMLTLKENRQLARDILSGIAIWRQRRAANPPQIALMRLYDKKSSIVRDQVTETEESFNRVISGGIDKLLVERIKRLSLKRQIDPPPQAG